MMSDVIRHTVWGRNPLPTTPLTRVRRESEHFNKPNLKEVFRNTRTALVFGLHERTASR